MRLFIVDDSDIMRSRILDMLSDIKGIKIIGQADDGVEAMDAIRNLKPDIVILDIKMPRGDGITVLETLKKGKNPPAIIMFTNYPYFQYRKKCLDSGADYFFYKAVEFGKLIDLLKKLAKKGWPS